MAQHRSYSAVKSLRQCGEQYRLSRVERVAQRPSSASIGGRVVHQATELVDYEIASGEDNTDVLLYEATRLAEEILDTEIENGKTEAFPDPTNWRAFGQSKLNPAGQDINWFRSTGIPGAIENYIHWRTVTVPHYELMVLSSGELAIEVPFVIQFGEAAEIWGQIDRVFVDTTDNCHVIVDIKSGSKPDTTEQLGLYKVAMGLDHPEGKPYYGSYVYGLKPGSKTGTRQTLPSPLSQWTEESLTKIYSAADRQIEQEIFLPNPGKSCFMCDVTHACPFYSASIV